MKSFALLGTAAAVASALIKPDGLDIKSSSSVRGVASTIAFDTMSYYKGNTSDVPKDLGDLQDPYYWWVAGALWGAMLDYYHYTKDPSYNDVIIEALTHSTNIGPNHDFMPPEHADEEGNDDLFFWGSAVISAAERNFPQPNKDLPSWLDIGANVFNELVGRWDTKACGGGLQWQIYEDNPNGMTYKNSVSNGGFFQIAARMARATGNDTYLDWAEKVWDWSWDVNFIDHKTYHIWDGADSGDQCKKTNEFAFTYTSGIYLYGAAIMADHTGKDEWANRAEKLLGGADWFHSPFKNSTNVLFEAACEKVNRCSVDMSTHKGTLARFLWHTAAIMPSLRDKIEKIMETSSKAAAKSCSGGDTGTQCGQRWYVGGYDDNTGLGQQMNALETVQGLLIDKTHAPYKADKIKNVRDADWSQSKAKIVKSVHALSVPTPSSESKSETSKDTEDDKKNAAAVPYADTVRVTVGIAAALLVSALL